ncbi:hypothetical protein [Nonlabens sp.]|nr:hypothetical protein [Nonlabens sp.]
MSVQQVNLWKREFLQDACTVFNKDKTSKKSDKELKEQHLLKVIG